ncbi:hypothetical protein O9993_22635 [Vibrio lentus]|nr:hypothetical protein [Vibrio lentus]
MPGKVNPSNSKRLHGGCTSDGNDTTITVAGQSGTARCNAACDTHNGRPKHRTINNSSVTLADKAITLPSRCAKTISI